MKKIEIFCEQFNVNDDEYDVVEVRFENGEWVEKDDILFTLETSKADIEVEAPDSGYFFSSKEEGTTVSVGELLGIINDSKEKPNFGLEQKDNLTNNLDSKIITQNALELGKRLNIDFSKLEEEVVTSDLLIDKINHKTGELIRLSTKKALNERKKLAFIGAGQGLMQVLDVVSKTNNFLPSVVYDDTEEKQKTNIGGVYIKGKINLEEIKEDFENGLFDEIIITVSTNIEFRRETFNRLISNNIPIANVISENVYIGENVSIGVGNIILGNSSIGTQSEIGNNNFISTFCNIEHHNSLGDNCTFGPGVIASGSVKIMNNVKFGTGIFIEPKVLIGSDSIIGSGCIITRNIPNKTLITSDAKINFKRL